MATKVKSGQIKIELDDTLEKMVRQIVERGAPGVFNIINDEMITIADNAQKNWLVRSSTNQVGTFKDKRTRNSADEFEVTTEIAYQGGIKIVGTIRNNAEYAYKIKVGKNSINTSGSPTSLKEGDHLWSKLVRDPLKKRATQIQKKITNELLKLQQG